MAKDFKQAIPTEYKGIVYRSKCEAMFARYLELELEEWQSQYAFRYRKPNVSGGGVEGGFIYEPTGFEVDGWNPDFLQWHTSGELFCAQIPHCDYAIIEYKPQKPTLTYSKTFAKRCCEIIDRFDANGLIEFTNRTSFYLYWGSVFSDSCGRIVVNTDFMEEHQLEFDDEFNWVINNEDEIRETRFDLAHER